MPEKGTKLPHVPLLRAGRPYRSLQVETLRDVRTGEAVVEVSQATAGMISRDLLAAEANRKVLERFRVAELLEICRKAARFFAEAELPLGEGRQSPDEYLAQLAATTGMPLALGRANMAKIVQVLEEMEAVLGGLTRGLDLGALDRGWTDQDGRKISYLRQTDALGAVLPNNSPGVHSLWLPAIPLKVPLVLRPGGTEPWTPYRVAQAFLAAGCPPEAFSFYPSDHGAAMQLLVRSGRSMIFGDQSTVERWQADPRVQPHGPGWSKVILGADQAVKWRDHLDLMVHSVAANGGRSCINASGVWLAAGGRDGAALAREVAEGLATALGAFEPRPLDDPEARLAAFAQPAVARRTSQLIDQYLGGSDPERGGAEDVTARLFGGERVVEAGGCTFLRPTVILCHDADHPLTRMEFGFPFVTVVAVPPDELLEAIGSTLVGTVITDDEDFRRAALHCEHIDRLNLGPIPTMKISWDQPHEGNLFEHLYRQRALQAATA